MTDELQTVRIDERPDRWHIDATMTASRAGDCAAAAGRRDRASVCRD